VVDGTGGLEHWQLIAFDDIRVVDGAHLCVAAENLFLSGKDGGGVDYRPRSLELSEGASYLWALADEGWEVNGNVRFWILEEIVICRDYSGYRSVFHK